MPPNFDSQRFEPDQTKGTTHAESVIGPPVALSFGIIQVIREQERCKQQAALKEIEASVPLTKSQKEQCGAISRLLDNIKSRTEKGEDEKGEDEKGSFIDKLYTPSLLIAEIEELMDAALGACPENKKALVIATRDHAKSFYQRAQTAVAIVGLVTTGFLLTVLSHGIFAAAGGALITEGIDRLDRLLGHNPLEEHTKHFQENNQRITEFSAIIEKTEEANYEKLNDTWITQIKTHCEAQKDSLKKMKCQLSTETQEHRPLLTEINKLQTYYEKQKEALDALDATPNVDQAKKTQAINKIAFAIQTEEKKAIPVIEKVKEALPAHSQAAANGFISRAKHFYHANKKMFRIAGLIALTITGVALTVATGGIAGLLGGAALGLVAINGIKSTIHHFKDQKEESNAHTLIDQHTAAVTMHCQTQEESLKKICGTIDKKQYPNAHPALKKEAVAYQENIQKLTTLKNSEENTQKKLKALSNISGDVVKTDSKCSEILIAIKPKLPDAAKKEALSFTDHAKLFFKENKKILSVVAKATLAVAAITALTICTGGTGLVIALGAAAVITLISEGKKLISNFANKHQSKKEEVAEGDGEGEGADGKKQDEDERTAHL